jgi:TolA-binding protein
MRGEKIDISKEQLKEKRKIDELIDKIDELENRIEALETKNSKKKDKSKKKKVKKLSKDDGIKPPWIQEGLIKQEWLEKKRGD